MKTMKRIHERNIARNKITCDSFRVQLFADNYFLIEFSKNPQTPQQKNLIKYI